MLDIMIFYVDRPIYDGSKKVGEMPHLWLGSYTPLTKKETVELDLATKNLVPGSLRIFKVLLNQIGKRSLGSNLLMAQQEARDLRVKKEFAQQLRILFPTENLSLGNMKKERECLKAMLARSFSPEEQVKMMMILKTEHDKSKQENEISEREDEIFARGIAECVQTLKDIPREKKSPLLRRLCFSSTHRQRDVLEDSVR